MAFRLISFAVVALLLTSCADGGFNGGTREFTGVWLYEFEGSSFVEGSTHTPAERPDYGDTAWLEWTEWPELDRLIEDRLEDEGCYTVQPFRVAFIGRKTHHPIGGAGHLGLWPSMVTVEKPISVERLGPAICYER
jgi:hypothetical protein